MLPLSATYFEDLPYGVERMREADITEVMAVDRQAFSTPWSYNAFHYEVERNEVAHYFVLRPRLRVDAMPAGSGLRGRLHRWLGAPGADGSGPILGYGGLWLMYDEAHISTIAVRPEWRRRGLGELLLTALLSQAVELAAEVVTLEVRVSNTAAQALYKKYGFTYAGRRRGYYTDNGEDAFLMTTPSLRDLTYRQHLADLAAQLRRRLLDSAEVA